MPYGLADEKTSVSYCDRFRSILLAYVKERKFSDKAVRIIPGERFPDFVIELGRMFGEHFRNNDNPAPTLTFASLGDGGTMANFDPALWQVNVNEALLFTKEDLPRKVAPVVFSSLYHEYRHAEQFSLMIRYFWAQHPAWLGYQNMLYNRDRNHLVPQQVRVSQNMLSEAYETWRRTVMHIGDGALQALMQRSLTSIGGSGVSLRAVRELALLPLCAEAGFPQGVIDEAALWYQSRFRSWAEEFGGRAKLLDPGRMFDADETAAANLALANANVTCDAADELIRAWNKAKPTGFPSWPLSQSFDEGRRLSALRSASKPFDKAAARSCFEYLDAWRTAAIRTLGFMQKWYEGVPLEADTHALERAIARQLKFSGKMVDEVAKSSGVLKTDYLPKPKDWSLEL